MFVSAARGVPPAPRPRAGGVPQVAVRLRAARPYGAPALCDAHPRRGRAARLPQEAPAAEAVRHMVGPGRRFEGVTVAAAHCIIRHTCHSYLFSFPLSANAIHGWSFA